MAEFREAIYSLQAGLLLGAVVISIRYYYRFRREPMALWAAGIWFFSFLDKVIRLASIGGRIDSETATTLLPIVSLLSSVLIIFYFRRVLSLLRSIWISK